MGKRHLPTAMPAASECRVISADGTERTEAAHDALDVPDHTQARASMARSVKRRRGANRGRGR